jgi:hypothetical protein
MRELEKRPRRPADDYDEAIRQRHAGPLEAVSVQVGGD